ncbi:MAG: 2-dehydro-3-deoxyglucarate aldolase [Planctomycetes bacterium]|nr:2-dehydro-3-deoxyglucarate aldolase [Planctomycetota bacterium]
MRETRTMFQHRNTLKEKLAQGQTTLGLWVTLEAPTITEIAVALGLDWIVIDAEHGHLDFKEIVEHIRVMSNTPTTALVRIQEIEQGLIKRVLDIGADGILVPQVYGADEVKQAVRLAKYPPWGIRGVGGERATRWGLDMRAYTQVANQETMVIPLMETVAAGAAIESILDVPGVDAIYFGPADYSSSAGHLGQWEGPGVAEQLLQIKDRIRARGVACGISSTDLRNARQRREQGFQMIGIGSDTGLLIRSAVEAIKAMAPGK